MHLFLESWSDYTALTHEKRMLVTMLGATWQRLPWKVMHLESNLIALLQVEPRMLVCHVLFIGFIPYCKVEWMLFKSWFTTHGDCQAWIVLTGSYMLTFIKSTWNRIIMTTKSRPVQHARQCMAPYITMWKELHELCTCNVHMTVIIDQSSTSNGLQVGSFWATVVLQEEVEWNW